MYGLTGEELAAFGDEVQLLVVGSRGYGPMKRLILGSTSDYLERHARCSLLVLPRSAGEPREIRDESAMRPFKTHGIVSRDGWHPYRPARITVLFP